MIARTLAGVLTVLVATATALPTRAADAGSCKFTATKYLLEDETLTTTSANFVPVPGAKLAIRLDRPGCVMVQVSGQVYTDGVMFLRVDSNSGAAIATPPALQFASSGPDFSESRAYTFMFEQLPAGRHEIALSWRTSSGIVYLNEYAMVVTY